MSLSLLLRQTNNIKNTLCLSLSGRNILQSYEYLISKMADVDISEMGHLPSRKIFPIYNCFIAKFVHELISAEY